MSEFLLLLFPLMEKVTKRSRRFDAQHSFRPKFSSAESPVARVLSIDGLKVGVSAACYSWFPGGAVLRFIVITAQRHFKLTRNKALEDFLRSKNTRRKVGKIFFNNEKTQL